MNVTFFNCSKKPEYGLRIAAESKNRNSTFGNQPCIKSRFSHLRQFQALRQYWQNSWIGNSKTYYFTWQNSLETEKGKSIPNWKTPINLDTWTISVQHEGQSQNPDGKKSPYPYVRAAAYIPTFLAFFQFHISDWFRSSSIYDYKRSRSPDIFQIFICHFDVTLYFINWMNFPYLRIETKPRLQKLTFGPKLEILDFIYLKMFSND